MKKIISLVLTILLILFSTFPIYSEATDEINIPIDMDFADNRVIVVFNNTASLKFKNYTENDFQEYSCLGVTDLSTATSNKVKAVMDNISDHILKNTPLSTDSNVNLAKYNQIICLELEKSGKENVLSTIEELNKRDDILYASPDYKLKPATTTPEDEMYDLQTYYNNIQLPQAWDITTGTNDVYVGIIDCGIDNTHPDLGNNINIGLSKDFTSTTGNGAPLVDTAGHGTACAGVIAANTNNNMGVSGVCWNIQVVSLKIATNENEMYSSKAISAINYAESKHIPILSMSVRWSYTCDNMQYYDYPMYNAISNYSGLFVCAAGNEGENNDANVIYPANYSLPNMITVGASNINDELWIGSNYGSTTVDIFAPTDVITTVPLNYMLTHDETFCTEEDHLGNAYHYFGGTSMATPMVAGVAALMLSVNPNLSARELKHIIIVEDDNIPALNNLCVSDGRLNAYKAVNHARNHVLNISYNTTMHSSYCNYCGYTQPEYHEYYFYSKLSGTYVLKCKSCPYSITCTHSPQYSYATDDGHNAVCSNCSYSLFEVHNLTYTQMSSLTTHRVLCADCGYSFQENHSWVLANNIYKCFRCQQTSSIIPGEIQSLSDEELELLLAHLTDEELADIMLALNEADRDRVAALAPVRKDDFVSE